MLEVGYDVIYTKDHWEWLRSAGRALKAHKRTAFIGMVVGLEDPDEVPARQVVVVRWNAGRPWPTKDKQREFPANVRHLAENLQTLP